MAILLRVALAAVAAYVVTGLVFAAGVAFVLNSLREWPFFRLPSPWKSTSAFVEWFIQLAASWPRYVYLIHGLWEIVVIPTVFFATLWVVYLAASRRSAPRRLKSTYPDNH